MSGYTGMRIESHLAESPSREVCIWYRDGKRIAVIYADAKNGEMRVLHEPLVRVQVLRRTGIADFEEEHDSLT